VPTKVQGPDAALALARAYGIKGRLPLVLDEVIVPVHIVGQLDPLNFVPAPGGGSAPPPGSELGASFVAQTNVGVGTGNRFTLVIDSQPGAPFAWVLDSMRGLDTGANTDFVAGIGIRESGRNARKFAMSSVAAPPFDNFGNPTRTNYSGPDPAGVVPFGLRMTQLNEANAFLSGVPIWRGKLNDANDGKGPWINLGWVMGPVRSAPDWFTADNVAIAQGNNEFWMKRRIGESAADGPFGVAFRFIKLAL
jgi:hypothetical protein